MSTTYGSNCGTINLHPTRRRRSRVEKTYIRAVPAEYPSKGLTKAPRIRGSWSDWSKASERSWPKRAPPSGANFRAWVPSTRTRLPCSETWPPHSPGPVTTAQSRRRTSTPTQTRSPASSGGAGSAIGWPTSRPGTSPDYSGPTVTTSSSGAPAQQQQRMSTSTANADIPSAPYARGPTPTLTAAVSRAARSRRQTAKSSGPARSPGEAGCPATPSSARKSTTSWA